MNKMKSILLVVAMLLVGIVSLNAANSKQSENKTAKSVLALAESMAELTPANSLLLKNEIKELSLGERIKLAKMTYKMAKDANNSSNSEDRVKAKPGLYILALFIPPLAVGLHTDWTKPTVYNFIWTLVGGLPGIIHAFIVLGR